MEATTQERPAPPPPSPSSVQMQLPHAAADPSNPFPTTFVQADTTSFKQVVQILTGTPETAAAFAAGGSGGCSGFSPRGFSPRGLEVLSPSMLDFPSLALGSPVTPLPPLPGSREAAAAEDRAIAEKGFYLHPSPRGNASGRGDLTPPPRLLPLFPLQSPTRQ